MMRKGAFPLVACLASLACPTGGAWSAPPPTVSCVDPGGGGDYADLQAALTAAESNADSDLIKVAQGTHAGNFVYESDSGHALWVYGGYEPGTGCGDRDLDPANTILDGGGAGGAPDLHDSSGADMKVDGLTLQNGGGPAGYYGGGIKAVSENDKTAGRVNSGHITITNSIVAGNAAISNGGGIYASSQSIAGTAGDVVLSNNRIHGNSAADYDGGGVLAESCSLSGTAGDVILKNSLVYENSAGRFGEAVAAYSRAPSGTAGSVTLVNNTITENRGSGVCYGFFASAGTV